MATLPLSDVGVLRRLRQEEVDDGVELQSVQRGGGKVPHPPAGATTLIVSLGILRQPWQLAVLMLAVALLVVQVFVINRLAGIDYPCGRRVQPPHRESPRTEEGVKAISHRLSIECRGALQRAVEATSLPNARWLSFITRSGTLAPRRCQMLANSPKYSWSSA